VGALQLAQVRDAAAAALAPVADGDPDVFAEWVDAVAPPALLLGWSDPWISARTVAGGMGLFEAALNVQAVASRVDPGAGFVELETLVAYVVARFAADGNTWSLQASTSPRSWEAGGIPLLGADLVFRVPVAIQEVA
jgi:hypothetical protein